LKQRGSLSIWFDPKMVWTPPPTGKRGRQQHFSDAAIQTCLTLKVLLGLPLRQTTGFVQNLLRLVGLDWAAQASRPKVKASGTPASTAAPSAAFGARFTYLARQGIDEETLEVRAVEVTTNNIGDAPMLPELLNQIPPDQDIGSVTADGAYDTRKCHEAIAARDACAVIPSCKNAKPCPPPLVHAGMHERAVDERRSDCPQRSH
jgi:hypothetical protein